MDRVYSVAEVLILIAQVVCVAWLFWKLRVVDVAGRWQYGHELAHLRLSVWWRTRKWKRAESHCREMAAQIHQQSEELGLWQLHVMAISHRERPYLEWLRKKQKGGRRG
jgi:hypothetical protein